jgi:hypothetical protein
MQPVPDPSRLPVAQPPPARHPRPAAHLLGEHLPRDAALQHKQDAGQRRPVWDRWSTAFRLRPLRRQQWFDQGPQFIGYERLGHAAQNGPILPPFPVSLGVLILQPGLVRSSSFPMASAGSLLMAATPARPGACGLGVRRPGPDQMPEQASHFRHGDRQQIGLEIERAFFPRRWRGGLRRDRHAPASPG